MSAFRSSARSTKCWRATTGWRVARVPALIPFQTFFELLASKQFPVATFIRTREELDYLQEPDIFHEIFGHCPLLTNPWFAEFTHTYGKLGLAGHQGRARVPGAAVLDDHRVRPGRYPQGQRIYGGGILSSPKETVYCLSDEPSTWPSTRSKQCARRTASTSCSRCTLSCPNLKRLFELAHEDIMAMVQQAMQPGLARAEVSAESGITFVGWPDTHPTAHF